MISGGGPSASSPTLSSGSQQSSQLQQSNQGTAHAVPAPPSPHVTVNAPNGGENWYRGSSYNITWSSYGAGGYVKIELYKDGTFDSTIVSSTTNSGSYTWNIPPDQVAASTYKVKITTSVSTPTLYDSTLYDSNPTLYDYSNSYFTISSKASVGTFWWYRGDGGLMYAQSDAEGFGNSLQADGCTWSKNKHDSGLSDTDIQYQGDAQGVDSVDIAYYVGHGGPLAVSIYRPFHSTIWDDPSLAEAKYCSWGDSGPNKWVVLATCLAGHGGIGGFQNALKGTHLILGWDTVSSDAAFGPVFAQHIKEGMTLKAAWFQTAEECEPVHARARVIGEDTAVGDDHLTGYGSYESSVTVDGYYTYWTHELNGWQQGYTWITPDTSANSPSTWHNSENSIDESNPDYVAEQPYILLGLDPGDITYTKFYENHGGWTDPLILENNYGGSGKGAVSIRGFRLLSGKDSNYSSHYEVPYHDQIELRFYLAGELQSIVTYNNWENGSWRIIDFDNPFQANFTDVAGVGTHPTVDKVEIRMHLKPGYTFLHNESWIGEFAFWQAGCTSPTVYGADNASAYTVIPDAYSPTLLSSFASKLGMSGDAVYADSGSYKDTYMLNGDNGKSLSYNTDTGMWKYVAPNSAYPTVSKEPVLPSDSQAVSLAMGFMQQNGISTADLTNAVVDYQKQGAAVKSTGQVIYEWTLTKTVYLDKLVNGVMDKVSVSIGENGNVVSFSIPTRTLNQ